MNGRWYFIIIYIKREREREDREMIYVYNLTKTTKTYIDLDLQFYIINSGGCISLLAKNRESPASRSAPSIYKIKLCCLYLLYLIELRASRRV